MSSAFAGQVTCPGCGSPRVGRLRLDADWGYGAGDWTQVNDAGAYSADDLAGFSHNDRPDIDQYVCIACGKVWLCGI